MLILGSGHVARSRALRTRTTGRMGLRHMRQVQQYTAVSISFSRSGKSPESVLAAERLLNRKPSAPQLMVTCDAAGAMASRLAAKSKGAW